MNKYTLEHAHTQRVSESTYNYYNNIISTFRVQRHKRNVFAIFHFLLLPQRRRKQHHPFTLFSQLCKGEPRPTCDLLHGAECVEVFRVHRSDTMIHVTERKKYL